MYKLSLSFIYYETVNRMDGILKKNKVGLEEIRPSYH